MNKKSLFFAILFMSKTLSITPSSLWAMEQDEETENIDGSSLTSVVITGDLDESDDLIIKNNNRKTSCGGCDLRYWGFMKLLRSYAEYLRGLCDGNTNCQFGQIVCCPCITGVYLFCMPFSCLYCGCFCPERLDQLKKENEEQEEQERRFRMSPEGQKLAATNAKIAAERKAESDAALAEMRANTEWNRTHAPHEWKKPAF